MSNHASYANGHIILHTRVTERDLIEEWKEEEDPGSKQYASFKIFDRKTRVLWRLLAHRITS